MKRSDTSFKTGLSGWSISAAFTWFTVLLVALSGCSHPHPQHKELPQENKIVIFAATSLRDAFSELGEQFKHQHPGIEITFNFAGTQELRMQLEQGAAVDIFASADLRHMDALVKLGRASSPVIFARNEPVLVVAKEFVNTIDDLADLPMASRIVIGSAEVPIGRYTLQILDRASTSLGSEFRSKVEAKVVSRELNVRQVLAKVMLGEAQVGFVYRTDAQSAQDRVGVVSLPSGINVIADYPVAVVIGAAHPELAQAWVDFLLSFEAQHTLKGAGFSTPLPGGSLP